MDGGENKLEGKARRPVHLKSLSKKDWFGGFPVRSQANPRVPE